MNMRKSIQSIKTNGKEYKYMEYLRESDNKKYRTDYYAKLKVDDKFKGDLKSIGGMSYKVIVQPIQDNVKYIEFKSYLTDKMDILNIVKHLDKNNNLIDYKYVLDNLYLIYISDFVDKRKESLVELGTTFDHLEDKEFVKLGKEICEPKKVDYTGISKGNIDIDFNSIYEIVIESEIKNKELREWYDTYKLLGIQSLILDTSNMEGAFSYIGDLKFKCKDRIANLDEVYYCEVLKDEDVSYEKYQKNSKLYILHSFANKINDFVDNIVKRQKADKEIGIYETIESYQKIADRFYERRKSSIERELKELEEDVELMYSTTVSKGFVELLLKENVTIIKIK